eukprot:3827512-Amphidinium_carterae.1
MQELKHCRPMGETDEIGTLESSSSVPALCVSCDPSWRTLAMLEFGERALYNRTMGRSAYAT